MVGIGKLDTSKNKDGGAVMYKEALESLGGYMLWHGWAAFRPYKQEIVDFEIYSTLGGEVSLNGYLSAKVES